MSKEHAPIQVEALPVVENDLLRSEHVEYCLAIQRKIGTREKVIYYKMGPDISTILLTTNATEIIGIDGSFVGNPYTQDYVEKYWDLVDKKPIPPPGAFGYQWGDFTAEGYQPSKDEAQMFKEDLLDRKNRGYWNSRSPLNFQTDRLLIIELKRLGIARESIKISPQVDLITEITFDWAFPREATKARKIVYLPEFAVTESKRNIVALLKGSDGYYQKGLSPENTFAHVQDAQPFLKDAAVVAIGHQFKLNKDNDEYQRELWTALGHWYRPVFLDEYHNNLIDKLPERDPDYEDNKYGMKMHVFERKQYPVRKYKYNFAGNE